MYLKWGRDVSFKYRMPKNFETVAKTLYLQNFCLVKRLQQNFVLFWVFSFMSAIKHRKTSTHCCRWATLAILTLSTCSLSQSQKYRQVDWKLVILQPTTLFHSCQFIVLEIFHLAEAQHRKLISTDFLMFHSSRTLHIMTHL